MDSTEILITECLKGNRKFQKELYDKYASKMLNLCHRYSRNNIDAEDILQNGFINVFQKLKLWISFGIIFEKVGSVFLFSQMRI